MNIRFAARSMNKTIPRTIVATLNFFLLGFIFGFVSALTRDPQHQILSALYVGANAGGFLALGALVFLPIDVYKFWRLTNRGRTAINTSSNNQSSKTSVRPPFFSKMLKATSRLVFALTGVIWFFVSGSLIAHRAELEDWGAAAVVYLIGFVWIYQYLFRKPMSMPYIGDLLPISENHFPRALFLTMGLALVFTISVF